jgi:uncharacterized protein DUF2867
MRLPNSEHESHPWRIAEVAPDFRLEDAWALPAWGGAEDFATLLEVMSALDPASGRSGGARLLFRLRLLLGRLFGWDDDAAGLSIPGERESSLSARLPEDLRGTATEIAPRSLGFTPLFRTDREWAAEISNKTVHGVLQLAWVEQGSGVYQGRLGVYVKPRGGLGAAYMALITPFRHLIVYPALMRQIAEAWDLRIARRAPVSPAAPSAAPPS